LLAVQPRRVGAQLKPAGVSTVPSKSVSAGVPVQMLQMPKMENW
jgi:hypothetical protein